MTVDAYALGMARANGRAADSWQAYARELEQKLVNAQAGLQAMQTLKDAAIKELGKVDPKNYLMVQANRQKIIDDAYGKKR